ncbi:MAG TPA: beta-ketoacyl-[acyl-carrier-protein] synthase family protein [Sedimentisphaerales bacterium]|nr:beta-ketoacyl-[acyl-carrier-protein] synthase family protein [Sedimentisphaerales bacterium]
MIHRPTTERVVIAGMGIVCPLGHDVETLWQAVLAGKSGVAKTTIFDASTFPTTFTAEVKDYDFTKLVKNPHLHRNGNRGSAFAIGAAAQACRQARIDIETDAPTDGIDRRRLGIYLGAGEGSADNDVFFSALVHAWDPEKNQMDWKRWADITFSKMRPIYELEQEPNMAAAHIALLTGARGPARSCLTACAASTQAVGEAMMMIRNGNADAVIAGGAHSMIHPLGLTGFNRLTALSTRNENPQTASRPFAASRDGFVLGEGAAILILESLASAKKRGVEILAEVIGYGSSSDAFRVTDMHEEGRGPIQAMTAALSDAGITYHDVDYINTHGTGTTENDSIETKAIKAVFKERAKKVPASSVKSMMGHLIGAAGAAELITCVLAIRDNIVPPTMNLNDPDPALDLDYVPNKPRKMQVNIAMDESFGFGGQNNVVIIRRYKE